jgi:hypothetical protein
LLRERLAAGQVDVEQEGVEESAAIKRGAISLATQLRRPLRTFIQELPEPKLIVTTPIEVICTLDEDVARATAPALGLLEEGYGDSVQEAIEELAKIIQNQYEVLTQPDVSMLDYAGIVRDRLKSFVHEEN